MLDIFYLRFRDSSIVRIIWCISAIILAFLITIKSAESVESLGLTNLIVGEILLIYFGNFKSDGLTVFFRRIHRLVSPDLEDGNESRILLWWKIFFQSLFYLMAFIVGITVIPKEISKQSDQKIAKVVKVVTDSISHTSIQKFANYFHDEENNLLCLEFYKSITEEPTYPYHILTFDRNTFEMSIHQEGKLISWLETYASVKDSIFVYGLASDEPFKNVNSALESERLNRELASKRGIEVATYLVKEGYDFTNTILDLNLKDELLLEEYFHLTTRDKYELGRSVVLKLNKTSE